MEIAKMFEIQKKKIAGHEFEGVGSDRRCTLIKYNGIECGKYYDDIKEACTPDYVGKPGYAHVDNISLEETQQIKEENDRLDRVFGSQSFKCGG